MRPRDPSKAVLFLSNGHGEDAIGAQIAQRVQALAGDRLRLLAFPLVGAGDSYRRAGIPVVGPQAELPSGGFAYLSLRNTLRDLLAGGAGLAVRQLRFARRHRHQWDAVVGVGDRVSLQLNHLILKKPMVWVAIAYSVRVVPPGKRFGNPRRWRPLRDPGIDAFVRDPDTQAALKEMGYRTEYVGNAMRDALAPNADTLRRVEAALGAAGWDGASPVVALLPGSRKDAFLNLPGQLEVLRTLHAETAGRVRGAVAWAPADPSGALAETLARAGWRLQATEPASDRWQGGSAEGVAIPVDPTSPGLAVPILRGAFAEILALCSAVIGQAGTAVEQAVGLGKPAVTFQGAGMQVTPRFLTVQERLLRGAIALAEPSPEEVAREALAILFDPERYRSMSEAGKRLMGPPGATDTIARRIVQRFAP
ncbi:lipid-A-disaccharide synthase-related protein [Limnochorda pilosa]|uniref:Lipid-A-disaccharide synthase n=1 Tax=Limnochorda pilosa TaxID=1555112 RepID=A0A0K2SMM3_LIMPI|nr:lipid-A-disaccharide synthase-related protein [Limnochorda pilosa]BAS28074.1 hypothetical protein LIP_2233 [Limnochorda pilosa]